MAANILRSERAIQISVVVVCAFVKMRAMVGTQRELAGKLAALEMARTRRLNLHERAICNITQQIIALPYPPPPQPKPPRKRIGFLVRERAARWGVT